MKAQPSDVWHQLTADQKRQIVNIWVQIVLAQWRQSKGGNEQ